MHGSDEHALVREMRSTLAAGALFGGNAIEIDLLRDGSSVGDGCSMYLLNRAYVLHLAPPGFPDVAAAELAAADAMRAVLGPHAGIMLDALESGRIDARSYFVMPLCKPLRADRLGLLWHRYRTAPRLVHGWRSCHSDGDRCCIRRSVHAQPCRAC